MSSYSTQTAVSDGTLSSLTVSLDYFDRSEITVYFAGVPTSADTGLWGWVGSTKTINFTPAVAFGVVVTIKRTTKIDAVLHDFTLGAQFRPDNLDDNFEQILHIAQEFADRGPSNDIPLAVVSDASMASAGLSDLYSRADHVHAGGGGSGGSGGNGTDGYSNAIVYAYQRSATAPAASPGAVTYSFSAHAISSPAGNALAGGWTKLIPAGSDPLYVTVATASGQTGGDSIGSTEWAAPVILAKDGINAMNVATVYAYQRTPTNAAPAAPSTTATYTFSTGVATGLNNGWTQSIPASFGGPYLWVITATAISAGNNDTIAPSEWASGLLSKDGADGANGGANGLSNASFYAYKRSSTAPTDNPGDVTYHFPSASITTPSTDALANGWFKTVPAGSTSLYVTVASASGSGTTDTVAAAEWTTPSLMGGGTGMSVATLYIYQRTTGAAPTGPTATVTFTFDTAQITGLTNGWSAAVPSSGGSVLWVTTATAAAVGNTDTIPTTEWATPQKLAQDGTNGSNGGTGATGSAGQRGTVQIVVSGSAWSDAAANAGIAAAGYGSPVNRDIVTISNGSSFTQSKFYDFGTWTALTAYIDGNLLVSGTVSAAAVSAGTLTGQTIQTAASGSRITINEAGNNYLKAYNSAGAVSVTIGGGSGYVYADSSGSSIPAIQGAANSTAAAVSGSNSGGSGSGVQGVSTAAIGVFGFNTSGSYGGSFRTAGSSSGASIRTYGALKLDGSVMCVAYPQTDNVWTTTNNVCPITDNVYYCGTLAARWAGITSATALLVSSDSRLKTEIENTPLGLSFINSLRPVAYKLVEGRKDITAVGVDESETTSVAGTRRHFGLIAQEVRKSLVKAGVVDAAFWALSDPENPESQQALRYEELISPMIAAINTLTDRVKALEAK